MAGISSLGVGSGLDLQGLLDQLQAAEQTRLKPFTDQKTTLNNQLTAWGIVKSSVAKLDTAAQNLKKAQEIKTTAVTSTNKNFSATVNADANTGSYSVSVLKLASGQVSQATQGAAKTDVVISGPATISFTNPNDANDKFEIALKEGNYTLEDVRKEINNSKGDVTAEIVYNQAGEGFLALSSKSTGNSSAFTASVTPSSTNPAEQSKLQQVFSSLNANKIKTAQDAEIQLNGVNISSSSNTFENVVTGVSITATEVSGTTTTGDVTTNNSEVLSITKDTGDLKKAIQAYVDAYNEVQATMANQTKFVPGKVGEELSSSNGDLMGSSALRNLQNQLRSQVTSVQSGAISTLNDLGIRLNNSGTGSSSVLKLEIDEKKLDAALADNADAVVNFFAGDGQTTGYGTNSANQLSGIMNGTTGFFKTQEDSLNSLVKRAEQNIERTTASIEANIERTRLQFEALDRMMAQMNSTSAYLNQQLASLSNQSKQ